MQTDSALRRGPVGLLYPGDMGTAVAKLLRSSGLRVVTSLDGRSAATVRNCRAAGIEEVPGLGDVVKTASILLVLVPPAAAGAVARQVRDQFHWRGEGDRLIYVDLNSIAPDTARAIAGEFAQSSVDFVDGAISGPAARLAERCVLYLSGVRAGPVAALFEGKMRVQVLGDAPGQASTMRMLLSGMTKGVIALFVEMAIAARSAGVLDRLLTAYRGSYPGIMEVVDRTLPSYPQHAARRGQEMAEVENTLAELGLAPTVTTGVRESIEAIAQCWTAAADRTLTAAEVIEELHARGFMRAHDL